MLQVSQDLMTTIEGVEPYHNEHQLLKFARGAIIFS